MNLTIGSKHFQVSLGVLAGAAIALFLFLHFGGSSIAIDNWLASGKQEVQAVHGVLARHASYVRQAAAARKKLGDSLTAVLGIVKAQQEAGAALLQNARTADQMREASRVFAQAGAACYDGLTLCKHRGDSLFTSDSIHTDSLRRALQAADTTLQRGLGVTECHLIHVGPVKLFTCPSRLTSFKVGLGVGAGTAALFYVLTHR